MIKKYWHKLLSAFYYLVGEKKHRSISNNGMTAIVNNGYLHISRAIEVLKDEFPNSDGIIVDVGGGLGTTAIMFAEAFKNKQVIVYEPFQKNLNYILSRIENLQCRKNITVIPKALSDSSGNMVLHILGNATSSSLLEVDSSALHGDWNQSLKEVSEVEVLVACLKDELAADVNIDILKLDTQGSELLVLKGALTLLKNIKLIVVEAANHSLYKNGVQYYEIDLFLRTHGFKLVDMIPAILKDRKLYEWDYIYQKT